MVTLATLTAALALATCSAGFSIYGLTSIFAGPVWPVVGMGAAPRLPRGEASTLAFLHVTAGEVGQFDVNLNRAQDDSSPMAIWPINGGIKEEQHVAGFRP
jgi:hypothetical protein